MLFSKNGRSLLGSLPMDSNFIGAGIQAVALQTPAGDVARLGRTNSPDDPYFGNRPRVPGILQASSFVRRGNLGYERLPFVKTLHKSGLGEEEILEAQRHFHAGLASHGYLAPDGHNENVGMDSAGRLQLLDPGFLQRIGKNPHIDAKPPALVGGTYRYAQGDQVHGRGSSGQPDKVPALLTPGEFVFSREAVSRHGVGKLRAMNQGGLPGYAYGGPVLGEGNKLVNQENVLKIIK